MEAALVVEAVTLTDPPPAVEGAASAPEVASAAMPTGAPAPAPAPPPAPKSPAVAAAPAAAAAPGAQRSSRSRTVAEQLEKQQNPIGRTVCSV